MADLAGRDRQHSFIRRAKARGHQTRSPARSRGALHRRRADPRQKLIKANGSGFMAAILPSGMRAISTEISPETGAGGFILPNDRVDVILSRRDKNPDKRRSRTSSTPKSS